MIVANELRHMNLHWFDGGHIGQLVIDDLFRLNVQFDSGRSRALSSFSQSQIKPLFISAKTLREVGFSLKAEPDDMLYTGWYFKDVKQYRPG